MTTRTDTINIKLPAGSQGTNVIRDILDSTFDKSTGVVAYINSKPDTLETFQLGIRNEANVFVAVTNVSHLLAGVDCPKNQRLTPVAIPLDNRNLELTVVLPAPLDAELNVDVVFELVKED